MGKKPFYNLYEAWFGKPKEIPQEHISNIKIVEKAYWEPYTKRLIDKFLNEPAK